MNKMKKIILVLTVDFLLTNIILSQSDWQLKSLGTDIQSCFFVNENTGWYVGNQNIVKTTNGGNSWHLQAGGRTLSLRSIYAWDSLNAIIAGVTLNGIAGAILKTTSGGNTWLSSTLSVPLLALKFRNRYLGWVVGSQGKIFRSTDGGVSWTLQNSGVTRQLYSLSVIDSLNVWVVGGEPGYEVLLKTTDGGNNWNTISTGGNKYFLSVCFVNINTGFISGAGGRILKTTNSGNNWTSFNLVDSLQFIKSLYFVDPDIGWCVGGNPQNIHKTTNCGNNWLTIHSGSIGWYNSIFFINSQIGWAGGWDNINCQSLANTTNGGMNWIALNTGTSDRVRSICFQDDNSGWAVGDRIKFSSTNQGDSWQCPIGHSSDYYRYVYFLNNQYGWIIGGVDYSPSGGGVILYTGNGGLTWTGVWSSLVNNFNDIRFTNPTSGIIIGYSQNPIPSQPPYGFIGRIGLGTSWTLLYTIPYKALKSICFVDVENG